MTITPNEKLKAAREARDWTRAYVAQCLEVALASYGHWERGIKPSEQNINKLCHLFRKTRAELGFEEVQ